MIAAPWTTLLFVPAHSVKHVQSAIRFRPSAVILDLEDGVEVENKPTARNALGEAQQLLSDAKLPCILRVNSDRETMALDLAAARFDMLMAIIVPKCNSVHTLEMVLDQDVKCIALIESPAAIRNLHEIAGVKSVHALMFGSEDYAAAMGVSPHAKAIEHAAALISIAAAAAGKPAYGIAGSLANFSNLEQFKQEVELSRALGFSGSPAIHPAQLPIIKNAFAPSQSEIDWATQVVEAHATNPAGAFKLGGRMVDTPVVRQAQLILARRDAG
jgi:citrate lyase subunit beta / citryl-CoA lyase